MDNINLSTLLFTNPSIKCQPGTEAPLFLLQRGIGWELKVADSVVSSAHQVPFIFSLPLWRLVLEWWTIYPTGCLRAHYSLAKHRTIQKLRSHQTCIAGCLE